MLISFALPGVNMIVTDGVSNVPQSFEANAGVVLRSYLLFLQLPVRLFAQFRASAKEGSRGSGSLVSGTEINILWPRSALSILVRRRRFYAF